ncbi:Uncharacterised protein [Klebsiella pneumoniae]|uniref:Uncharacterized protein n=1 Tax=Klebsiella pneumoniae TaxID=573 RepID=A0A377XMP9_KLEPN|nr:Uncharacterised protein [Klebsiella pneumoniae]
MNREFEIWVRLRYGGRYDLTRDGHGYYCGKWLNVCMKCGATVVA